MKSKPHLENGKSGRTVARAWKKIVLYQQIFGTYHKPL
jgi:hypothetical protein